jgi:hypothetical protein
MALMPVTPASVFLAITTSAKKAHPVTILIQS